DVLDSAAGQNYVFTGNFYTGALAIIDVTSTFAAPGYTGDDASIVYSVADLSTPTQFSLERKTLAEDRISPTGPAQTWLTDAGFGVVYRRGDYFGPALVDVAVSQSATTGVGHRAIFQIDLKNVGLHEASDVQLLSTLLPSGVDVTIIEGNGMCNVLNSGRQVSCEVPVLQPGASELIEIAVTVHSAAPLTISVTAFASEPDEDVTDNTSFSAIDAAMLNVAPAVVAEIGSREGQVGAAFSLTGASHFEDADGDA